MKTSELDNDYDPDTVEGDGMCAQVSPIDQSGTFEYETNIDQSRQLT